VGVVGEEEGGREWCVPFLSFFFSFFLVSFPPFLSYVVLVVRGERREADAT
jgi:hypothetical protein